MAKTRTSFDSAHNPKRGIGGPGRKPAEKSLTKALRDKADPQALADKLLAMTNDPDQSIALRATTYLFDRLDGTPIQSLRTQADDLPQIVIAGPSHD